MTFAKFKKDRELNARQLSISNKMHAIAEQSFEQVWDMAARELNNLR